jgi:hypothetical protein
MLMIWFNKPHDLSTFTPAWAFLIFPMMLVGVVAFNVLKVIPPEEPRAIGVLLVGYAFQGLGMSSATFPRNVGLTLGKGFFMTFFYICIYIIRYGRVPWNRLGSIVLTSHSLRIMMTGFLEGHQANGAFVAVGPPGESYPRPIGKRFR